MPRVVALLRAVNVGGSGTLPMADLRTIIAELGFADAQTLLQSGNVVFTSRGEPAEALEGHIEGALRDRAGLPTEVMVRDATQWGALIAANPFSVEAAQAPALVHAVSLKVAPPTGAIEALREAATGPEQMVLISDTLYVTYPNGAGRSKLTSALIERQLGTRATARNWNTVLKIGARLEEKI